MKKLFLFMAAIGITLTAGAQKTEMQMATLQQNGETQVFYGPHSLINAINSAIDSSAVITLSSGEFIPPSYVQKSISIFGVGFEDDNSTGTKQTYINGQLRFKPADTTDGDGNTVKSGVRVNGVHLEGLKIGSVYADDNNSTPIYNMEIVKCKINNIGYYVTSYNNVIRQCVITQGVEGVYNNNSVYANNLLIANSYLQSVRLFTNNSTIKVDHCLLYHETYHSPSYYTYTNSIFSGLMAISNYSYVSNCIFMEGASYSGVLGENNWTGLKNAGVWAAEGEDGTYAESKDFALKYPDRYIGTDGTEVGLHGGAYPWNKIPSIPRITECTIDTENAANGTIKLSIKAEAQTKE